MSSADEVNPPICPDCQFRRATRTCPRQLTVEETVDYARHRWPASIGEAVRGQWHTATGA